jgi:hypothetical protein
MIHRYSIRHLRSVPPAHFSGKVEIIFNKSQGLPMTHQFFGIHVHGVHRTEFIILLSHMRPSKRGV